MALSSTLKRGIPVLSALVLTLSGCSGAGQSIDNFIVEIDTKFEGTIDDAARSRPVVFRWEAAPLQQSEEFILKLDFSKHYASYVGEHVIDVSNQGRVTACFISNECKLVVDGDRHTLTAYMENPQGMGISIYWYFISSESNSENPISLIRQGLNQEEISTSLLWKRTPRTEKPRDPVLTNKWTFDRDGYAKYEVSDSSKLTFDSFPNESIENCIGRCRKEGQITAPFHSRRDVFYGYVKGVGESIKVERQIGNEIGKSKNVTLEIRSPANECKGSLKIDELGNNEFACGILNVEVIQSDLNTGECQFLGYWKDRSGSKKLGLFEYCDTFTAGSFKENKSYSVGVIVGKPVEYKTRLGTDNRVLSFTITG